MPFGADFAKIQVRSNFLEGIACSRAKADLFHHFHGHGVKKESLIMAHKVTDACVGCGACEGACPVGAVAVENGVAVVNADTCIDCGACEGVCPTGAIVAE